MNQLVRTTGFVLIAAGVLVALTWFIEPLREVWPWLLELPLPIRVGLSMAGVGNSAWPPAVRLTPEKAKSPQPRSSTTIMTMFGGATAAAAAANRHHNNDAAAGIVWQKASRGTDGRTCIEVITRYLSVEITRFLSRCPPSTKKTRPPGGILPVRRSHPMRRSPTSTTLTTLQPLRS